MNPPTEPPSIRTAQLPDAEAMAAMSHALIERGLPWKYTGARIADLIRDPQTVALVSHPVDAPGSPIEGMAIMHFGDEQAHLVLLCVLAHRQRCGLGSDLLGWLLQSARVAGIAEVHLELRADNAQAHSFYNRLGFNETQRVADYYGPGVDARRMVLALRRPVQA